MHARRRPFVGGNWKMNTTRARAVELARALGTGVQSLDGPRGTGSQLGNCEVAIFPPFTALREVAVAIAGSSLQIGGQDVSPHRDGAFTGQISAEMLVDAGATWIIIGHSERRHGLGETDRLCGQKLDRAIEAGLRAVFCVGETWEERSAGVAAEITRRQLAAGFERVPTEALERIVIAYEPVWAIGTGKTASAQDAQEAHGSIREWLASRYDSRSAEGIRILYGGSVNASNAAALFNEPDIDGGLIGGASLKSADFLSIVAVAQSQFASFRP